uniref:PPPDE domain-containing protein n=1 Tax=Pyrodinium bahamense TaxID=73915 RepID=A0A7S0BCF3_9DINO|mmetsp:Transcript_9167/g.25640  ORF Transcript_9167/g.25640 Transcript_9167/m.25640 type:complete len:195 (+) Transcript_9167:77-661(+)
MGEADEALPALTEVTRSQSRRGTKKRHEVWLHVYDIDSVTARINDGFLRALNMGAFHCGVEVLGDEWFFAWGETEDTGITWNKPRLHQVHVYKESVYMGESTLSEVEIRRVLAAAMENWPGNSYHPLTRNCISFAEELVASLGAPESFPVWVRGAVDAGNSPLLFPIADWGWQWVKWWCTSSSEEGQGGSSTGP